MDLIDDADMDKKGINAGFLVQKDGICIVAEDLNAWPLLVSFAKDPTEWNHVPLRPNGKIKKPRHEIQALNDFRVSGNTGDLLYVVSQ